jgi:hypothetical protein
MLTTHLHLAPRLRMSGAIHLSRLYAFMAWTETTMNLALSFKFICFFSVSFYCVCCTRADAVLGH